MADYKYTGVTFEITQKGNKDDILNLFLMTHYMNSLCSAVQELSTSEEIYTSALSNIPNKYEYIDQYVDDSSELIVYKNINLHNYFDEHASIGFTSDGTLPDNTPRQYSYPTVTIKPGRIVIFIPYVSKRNNEMDIEYTKRLINTVFGQNRLLCTDSIYADESMDFKDANTKSMSY